jgi:hypothetical protein
LNVWIVNSDSLDFGLPERVGVSAGLHQEDRLSDAAELIARFAATAWEHSATLAQATVTLDRCRIGRQLGSTDDQLVPPT